jgi:hypothetical protein
MIPFGTPSTDNPDPIVALRHLVFNQRAIQALKPHAREFVEYYDAKTAGFALRVQPSGKKTFYFN